MSKIDEIIQKVLGHEGGYVNHPNDRGGPTNHGITLKTLEVYLGRKCTEQDIKNINKTFAAIIYNRLYYTDPKINLLPEDIQPVIFDIAVNSGPERAIKMLQSIIGCVADGVLGNFTIKESNKYLLAHGEKYFIKEIVNKRIKFYKGIVEADPSQEIFLKGWIARAESFDVA